VVYRFFKICSFDYECFTLVRHVVVVVVLPDTFREIGAWRNSTETQQSGHALKV